ncbi:MAG: CapA family protein [Clostridiales bacterium]|nr:CapA family protein [Clostridiales bacterium]
MQWTLAATGDFLISQKLLRRPGYDELRGLLAQADAAFTNLESLFHRFDGIPAAESGGTYVGAHPSLVEELLNLRFRLVAWANNHTLDWGYPALFSTAETLERAGITHAGVGPHLAAARSPAYLDLPQGRVALVAACSSFPSGARAGEQRPDAPGRPGINPLRFSTVVDVEAHELEALQALAERYGLLEKRKLRARLGFAPPIGEGEVPLEDITFRIGEGRGLRTATHPADEEGNLKAIEEARRQADAVLFSLHHHEFLRDPETPAEFIRDFAQKALDQGAIAFLGHGPHLLQGIEIYKGRPIFYSLGNFVFQNETVLLQPADFYEKLGLEPKATPGEAFEKRNERGGFLQDPRYFETVVAVLEMEGDRVREIRLYPVELGFGLPRPQRGSPTLARGDHARRILERLKRLSEPFGTAIAIEGPVGIIRP